MPVLSREGIKNGRVRAEPAGKAGKQQRRGICLQLDSVRSDGKLFNNFDKLVSSDSEMQCKMDHVAEDNSDD